jgi:hypothetical protein
MSDFDMVVEDEVVEVEAPEVVETQPLAERKDAVMVTLDNDPRDVLKYDAEGKDVFFSDQPGTLLELPPEVLAELPRHLQTRYDIACGVHARLKHQADHPELVATPGLEVVGRLATATSRLDVRGKTPGMHYCWKRTDELRQSGYEGYKVADEKELDTFGSQIGTTRTVGEKGDTELVLMKIPEETYLARQRAISEKSRKRVENVEQSAAQDMRRSGGKPLDVNSTKGDGRNWG